MSTKKITQKELEEMVREMVTKMTNEMPGEAPVMEKKLTDAEKKAKERLVKKLKPVYGKTPKTYAIATDIAKDIAEGEGEYTKKYDDSPSLKGKQKTNLPDRIQAMIVKSKEGKEKEEGLEEKSMSFSYLKSRASKPKEKERIRKGMHQLEEEKIKRLEEKKRALIKQLEELNFEGAGLAEPETDTETDVDIETPTTPRRPNPFRREDDDTQIIPDLEPQGSLKDVVKRYLDLKR